MASKKLARNVNWNGVLYPAGSSPDKEIADEFTNPKVWEADEESTPTLTEDPAVQDEEPATPAKKTASKKSASSK